MNKPIIKCALLLASMLWVVPSPAEDIDLFIDSLKTIAKEAQENPELLRTAPQKTKRRRLDETSAARKPCLRG